MRRTTEQTVSEELAEGLAELSPNIRELAARFAEVTKRLELAERLRSRCDEETDAVVHPTNDESRPIEYVTANGVSIVRPWEEGSAPKPTGGTCRFAVCDAEGQERRVNVTVAEQLIAETAFRTRGRIHDSSSFWICCAERHLANYVWEHDAFPDGDRVLVETLDPEEVILALSWEAPD